MVADNQVWFLSPKAHFTVTSGHFVVSDFCVTDGQATDIKKGDESWFRYSDHSGFHFAADRYASAQVATWFNDRVNPPSQNTFGHAAEYLNLAVQGTLTLFVQGEGFEADHEIKFNDAFLAQGHSGTSNNWWFAIKGAVAGDTDEIKAKDQNGHEWTFWRGANWVSEIAVRP
jgi:hypothetical protein